MTRWGLLAAAMLVAASTPSAQTALADEPRADVHDEAADRAEELADAAYERFQAGEFAEAIELYRQSYAADPSARVLFDIATIYDERLHEAELAREYYRRYQGEPDAEPELTQTASARLAALESAAPPPSSTAPPAFAPPPAPTPAPMPSPAPAEVRPFRTWGLVTLGAGVAVLATGTVFGLVAKSKNDDAAASCSGDVCTDPRAIALTNDAANAARVADVAFAAGAALTAAGVVLVLWAPQTSAARVRVTTSLGGLGVSGNWR